MNFEKLSEEIFSRYGNIKRARGNFLYTEKGTRLTDLYRENGRAIFGYRETSAFTMLKNALGRGVTGSYRTCENNRLEKAVCELLDSSEPHNRKIFIFNDLEKAVVASSSFETKSFAVYKPWNWEKIDNYSEIDVVLFEPTLPWSENIYILAVKSDLLESKDAKIETENFETCLLNSPMIASYTRSIYDLMAAKQNLSEKDFFIFDKVLSKYFERKGPWLFPKKEIFTKENYDNFVLECLDKGIILNPSFDHPSIVPIGCDKGIFSKLK